MPVYRDITYNKHAEQRIRKRRLSRQVVELVLRIGDGDLEDDGTWVYELEHIRKRLLLVERGTTAHIVTVIRMRKST